MAKLFPASIIQRYLDFFCAGKKNAEITLSHRLITVFARLIVVCGDCICRSFAPFPSPSPASPPHPALSRAVANHIALYGMHSVFFPLSDAAANARANAVLPIVDVQELGMRG